ncbi:MAG: 3'-5' exonuclease [Verrucomicrobiales bacterium]|nr:3'-5' exonuclease [Verrucomicrobiales bacterium]
MNDFHEPNVIPSNIRSDATTGEKLLHGILQRLPDECISYYEPEIDGRRPDFVVLVPQLGLLVIEEKGWYPGTIVDGDRDKVIIRPKGADHVIGRPNPIYQARSYQFRLSDKITGDPYARNLQTKGGPYQGNLRFPMTHLTVLSNISSAQFYDRNLDRILDPKRVVTRDRLQKWNHLGEDEFVSELHSFFDPFWQFASLSANEINVLRSVINPQLLIGRGIAQAELEPQNRPLDEQADTIVTLDRRQENVARSLGEGHRILYGVAGSGKTLLLIARARAIAARSPEARILLVCYNKCLAQYIDKHLADCANVTVSTFHGWGSQNEVTYIFRESETRFGERLLHALESGSTDRRSFDCILVDEAQDFDESWFRCLVAAMKDPEDGDLLIVADRAQQIYQRQKFTWSSVGIKARGRSHSKIYDLDRNYRNSSEILALAETIATRIRENFDEGEMPTGGIDISRCERSTGAAPVLWMESSFAKEMDRVAKIVEALLSGQWRNERIAPLRANQIGILLPYLKADEKSVISSLKSRLENELGIRVRYTKNARPQSDALSIQTIHSSKGLQYRAVIIPAVEKLYRSYAREPEEKKIADARHLLYVGATRAESFLALSASGDSPILEDLRQAPGLEVVAAHLSHAIQTLPNQESPLRRYF